MVEKKVAITVQKVKNSRPSPTGTSQTKSQILTEFQVKTELRPQ